MTKHYHVIYNDNFNLDAHAFSTLEDAFQDIEKRLSEDRFVTEDKILIFHGERILFDVKKTTNITVSELSDK